MMFLQLPVELQHHCVQSLDVETLKCFRLVSKAALALVTESLFETINLLPSDESAEKYTHVLEDARLKQLVRTATFNTSEYPNASGWAGDASNEESELLESFADAMRNVGRFPNLREVELKFARECAAADSGAYSWDKEVAETQSFRFDVLEAFLEGLNNPVHLAINVDSLTIKNLQDVTDQRIYKSDNFRAVLGRLKKLHLQIATESDDAAPEHSIDKAGCHRMFNHDLRTQWLEPLQSQLTHLTLYATESFWGFWPYCDLRGIHFPKLKSLSLGNWTIVHDWQIDFILSHGKSLEELILDDCPIVTVLKMYESQIQPHWPDLKPISEGLISKTFIKEVGMRWNEVLSRFQSGLPYLRHFSLGQGDWDEQSMFEERYEMLPRLLWCRYHMFDCGIGPSQWVGGNGHWVTANAHGVYTRKHEFFVGKDKREEFEFPACDGEDMDALIALLEVVEKRAVAKV